MTDSRPSRPGRFGGCIHLFIALRAVLPGPESKRIKGLSEQEQGGPEAWAQN